MSTFQRGMFVAGDAVIGAAVLVMLGVWGGGYLDEKLHTAPWGSLGLSILGGVLGLWRMIKKATALDTPGVPSGAKPIPFDTDDKDDDGFAEYEKTDKQDS
ncbi:MAG: AtpZ/AtpI family protein [Candidatus Melainabacteria bacterium]|nr:AtpZ/AtpI family protein [Candidatus Melainabacteria bacterium]